jgi:hypothetical protein
MSNQEFVEIKEIYRYRSGNYIYLKIDIKSVRVLIYSGSRTYKV